MKRMSQNSDPIEKAITSLPDEPIAPRLAAEVQQKARLHLEADRGFAWRLDHFMMDQLMPAALSAVLVGYGFGLVDYFQKTYVNESVPVNASASASRLAPSITKRVANGDIQVEQRKARTVRHPDVKGNLGPYRDGITKNRT
jgi:hypothetical protein